MVGKRHRAFASITLALALALRPVSGSDLIYFVGYNLKGLLGRPPLISSGLVAQGSSGLLPLAEILHFHFPSDTRLSGPPPVFVVRSTVLFSSFSRDYTTFNYTTF